MPASMAIPEKTGSHVPGSGVLTMMFQVYGICKGTLWVGRFWVARRIPVSIPFESHPVRSG